MKAKPKGLPWHVRSANGVGRRYVHSTWQPILSDYARCLFFLPSFFFIRPFSQHRSCVCVVLSPGCSPACCFQCSFDSTGNPCSECSLQGSECIVDEAADKRRKAAGRRIQEELLLYQDTLKVAQEQIKVLQQELRDTKYEFSMMLMEKERVLDATSTFLDKLLGVLRKNDSVAFSALIGTIRSGAGNAQIMGVLDQLMP